MPLVSMKEMLADARREHRAVGAFNVANYETALAWGYTSVMFDGSHLPYAENAARTKAVADR